MSTVCEKGTARLLLSSVQGIFLSFLLVESKLVLFSVKYSLKLKCWMHGVKPVINESRLLCISSSSLLNVLLLNMYLWFAVAVFFLLRAILKAKTMQTFWMWEGTWEVPFHILASGVYLLTKLACKAIIKIFLLTKNCFCHVISNRIFYKRMLVLHGFLPTVHIVDVQWTVIF